jgi:hypothetical protein
MLDNSSSSINASDEQNSVQVVENGSGLCDAKVVDPVHEHSGGADDVVDPTHYKFPIPICTLNYIKKFVFIFSNNRNLSIFSRGFPSSSHSLAIDSNMVS